MRIKERAEHSIGGWAGLSGDRRKQILAVLIVLLAILLVVRGPEALTSLLDVARSAGHAQGDAAVKAMTPERLVFDIKQKNFQRLRYQREVALHDNINVPGSDDYVPAEIRHGDETLQAKMRLKGVFKGHWVGKKKWSYQVKLKGSRTLLGMKRFSLQHPDNRNYIYEWLFLKAVEDEGLIALRFDFVEMVVNGEELGLFSMAEHFGRRLLEANSHREGPIIGFNKDLLLEEYRRRNVEGTDAYNVDGAFWSSYIDAMQHDAGGGEDAQILKAMALLESFRLGTLPPSDVFALDKMALGMALKAVFGAYEFDWKDLKFYYNPLTGKLEPLLAEVHHGSKLPFPGWWVNDGQKPYKESFTSLLFADEEFSGLYVQALERLTRPEYMRNFLDAHAEGLAARLALLRTEFPHFDFQERTLFGLQKQIRTLLTPQNPVRAHLSGSGSEALVLELGNLQHFPIRVLSLHSGDGAEFLPAEPILLPGKKAKALVDYRTTRFLHAGGAAPDPDALGELTLRVTLHGFGERPMETQVLPWSHLRGDLVSEDPIRGAASMEDHPFLVVDRTHGEVNILPGEWSVTRNVIFPSGYRVLAGPGVSLDLKGGAMVLSRSPLLWQGTAERPVRVYSSDQTGQGLAVMDAGEESVLEHVHVSALGAPDQGGWTLSGAVTFYQSDVSMEHCILEKNTSGDDLLNIVRSAFTLDDCRLAGARADAFDSDFSTGTIRRTEFLRPGNDGLDCSGSRVRLDDVRVVAAGDKGLSIGEESFLEGGRVSVEGSHIGLAAKDASKVRLRAVKIKGAVIALALYQKKPEHGPAHVVLHEYSQEESGTPYLVEVGSTLELDGTSIPAETQDLRKRLER